MAVGDAYVFPGFLTPVLTQLFFPKPPTTFLTCFCRGERRKYAGKKSRLNRGSNSLVSCLQSLITYLCHIALVRAPNSKLLNFLLLSISTSLFTSQCLLNTLTSTKVSEIRAIPVKMVVNNFGKRLITLRFDI